MSTTVAELKVDGLRPDGSIVPIVATVGLPFEGEDGAWCCPCALHGIDGEYPGTFGDDSMQALGLAMWLIHNRLTDFRKSGGRLIYPGIDPADEDADFDLSVYFGPSLPLSA